MNIRIKKKKKKKIRFFFFKQKTAYEIKECDWSSDVCSSDLREKVEFTATNKTFSKPANVAEVKSYGKSKKEQDGFLFNCIRSKISVTILLYGGDKRKGIITDRKSVV